MLTVATTLRSPLLPLKDYIDERGHSIAIVRSRTSAASRALRERFRHRERWGKLRAHRMAMTMASYRALEENPEYFAYLCKASLVLITWLLR